MEYDKDSFCWMKVWPRALQCNLSCFRMPSQHAAPHRDHRGDHRSKSSSRGNHGRSGNGSSRSSRHRRDHSEVSCCLKYVIFGFNVIFWVRESPVS